MKRQSEFAQKIGLLKNISDLAVSGLDPSLIYRQMILATSQLLGVDKCSLVLGDKGTGGYRIKAACGIDPEVMQRAVIRVGEGVTGYVLKTGEPLLVTDIERHPLFHRRSEKKYTTPSLLSVPLKVAGRIVGVLNVNNKIDGTPLGELDQFILTIVANHITEILGKLQVGDELLRHRVVERDLKTAAIIQKHLLPRHLPEKRDYMIQAESLPAQALGGDLYDVLEISRRLLVLAVGDVSGKGIAAALYMANIAGKMRLLAHKMRDPGKILLTINNALVGETIQGNFATMFLAFYDRKTRILRCAEAGHPSPILRRRADRSVREIDVLGAPPLGIFRNIVYPVSEVQLQPGDCVLFFTDGLIEAKSESGERYTHRRLLKLMADFNIPDDAMLGEINRDLYRFMGGIEAPDDITAVKLIVR